MPLTTATPRNMLHSRDIFLRGYEREDGLIDVEAHMTDVKSYSWDSLERGAMPAGTPLHDMWLRVTIDRRMTITGCEAAMDATPSMVCPGVAPNYGRLVGLNIGRGFLKAAMALLGGVQGCTHLRELLQQVGTVAFQTMMSVNARGKVSGDAPPGINPALLNTCYAYDENGPLAKRYAAARSAPVL